MSDDAKLPTKRSPPDNNRPKLGPTPIEKREDDKVDFVVHGGVAYSFPFGDVCERLCAAYSGWSERSEAL